MSPRAEARLAAPWLPPCSAGLCSIRSMPRSTAARPRVMGAITSDRCLIGATSISMAVMKATKLPTVAPPDWLCHSASTITADSAQAASICVTGVIVAPATTALSMSRRTRSARARKRADCRAAGAVQAHDAPGQHVLLDHVGQLVGGLLAFDREAVQPLAQSAHHQRHGREQQAHEQRELPVQPQQIAQQRHQRERVAHQRQQRAHEHA